MAVAEPIRSLLTYEAYMAEPEIAQRYDIIEGVRYFMSSPTWQHQRILRHVIRLLEQFEDMTGRGYALMAPLDILIRRVPRLQTRQPDAFFVTHERISQGGGIPQKGPVTVGPELVVEIVSDTEREQMLQSKLTDYAAIGVQEAWVVRPATDSVELIRLSADGVSIVAAFGEGETLRSEVFPEMAIPVADLFKP